MCKHFHRVWAGLDGMPGIYKDRHLLSFWLKATCPFWFLSSLLLSVKVQNEIKETCFKYKQTCLFRCWSNGPRYRLRVSYLSYCCGQCSHLWPMLRFSPRIPVFVAMILISSALPTSEPIAIILKSTLRTSYAPRIRAWDLRPSI